MSALTFNPAEMGKDHALVHFFALLAAFEDIDLATRLLASGISSFLRMDAVVVGFANPADHTFRIQVTHLGIDSEPRWAQGDVDSLQAEVAGMVGQFGYPLHRSVALVHLGKTIGHLAVARCEPADFTAEEEFLLTSLQTLTSLLFARYSSDVALRHSQDEVKQSQQWLRVTLTSIGDGVMTSDAAGRVTFLNPVAEELTGWTLADAFWQPIQRVFRIVDEQSGRPAPDIVAQVLRDGQLAALANHTCIVTKDGRAIPIDDSAAPIKDASGNVVGVVLVFHDVTERRRAQQALRESERRVRLKLESILSPEGDIGNLELADVIDVPALQGLMDQFYELTHMPIGIIDLNGRVLVGVGWQEICTKFHRVSPESCRHCIESDTELSAGVPPGEFRLYHCKNHMWDVATPITVGGKHVGNLFSGQFFFEGEPLDHELFRAQARQYGFDQAKYLAALERVGRLKHETVTIGMTYLAQLANMISQLSYSNVKLARSVSERDRLTDSLRANDARLRFALQAAKSGTWEWDLQTDKTTWSEEFWTLSGLEPYSCEPSYEAWLATVYPPQREMFQRSFQQAALGATDLNLEYRMIEAGGKTRWLMVRGRPVRDGNGCVVRLAGILMDIDERKRTEAALLQSEKLASVGRMATTIAHEINNPLAAVMNTLFLAKMTPGAPEYMRKYLDTADTELRRVAQITRQALGFYRESSSPAAVSVKDVVDSTTDLLASKIKAKNAIVQVECHDYCQLTGVAGELRQVIANLLANSLDAIGQGGKVKVRCVNLTRLKRACVRITIADNGKGIEPQLLPRVFEPFFTTKDAVGTGLGLWVSQQIVHKHGGVIRLRSATTGARRGTVFVLLLPAESALPAPTARRKAAAQD